MNKALAIVLSVMGAIALIATGYAFMVVLFAFIGIIFPIVLALATIALTCMAGMVIYTALTK